MTLRLRRCTEAERESVVFAEGELIYTTDTKELYVGDGTTLGGILVSQSEETPVGGLNSLEDDANPQLGGNLNLNNFEINGIGDIDITGSVSANIISGDLFVGDGSGLTNLPTAEGLVEGSNYRINIVNDSGTVMVNTTTNTFTGNLVGDSIFFNDNSLKILNSSAGRSVISIESENEISQLKLIRATDSVILNEDVYGRVDFGVNIGGVETTRGTIGVDNLGIFFNFDIDGIGTLDENFYVVFSKDQNFGIGVFEPTEKLEVNGNAIIRGDCTFTGAVNASSLNSSIISDDSSTIIDASNGTIFASSFIQFGLLTTLERDELTPSNGMVLYNVTENKFQGYQAGSWINLDGTS